MVEGRSATTNNSRRSKQPSNRYSYGTRTSDYIGNYATTKPRKSTIGYLAAIGNLFLTGSQLCIILQRLFHCSPFVVFLISEATAS
jgi:hypothetical protein